MSSLGAALIVAAGAAIVPAIAGKSEMPSPSELVNKNRVPDDFKNIRGERSLAKRVADTALVTLQYLGLIIAEAGAYAFVATAVGAIAISPLAFLFGPVLGPVYIKLGAICLLAGAVGISGLGIYKLGEIGYKHNNKDFHNFKATEEGKIILDELNEKNTEIEQLKSRKSELETQIELLDLKPKNEENLRKIQEFNTQTHEINQKITAAHRAKIEICKRGHDIYIQQNDLVAQAAIE